MHATLAEKLWSGATNAIPERLLSQQICPVDEPVIVVGWCSRIKIGARVIVDQCQKSRGGVLGEGASESGQNQSAKKSARHRAKKNRQ